MNVNEKDCEQNEIDIGNDKYKCIDSIVFKLTESSGGTNPLQSTGKTPTAKHTKAYRRRRMQINISHIQTMEPLKD